MGNGRMGPCGPGIAQQRGEAVRADAGLPGQTAEVDERAIQVHEVDGALADGTGTGACGQAGCSGRDADHEGHAGADAPTGEFLPVLLFAKMPAVVAPKNDDGVVAMRTFIEGIEHAAEHGVGEMDGGEVGLDALFPLAVFLDVGKVAVAGELLACGGDVIKIPGLVAGAGLDRFEWKGFEVSFGHEPRFVRTVDAAGKEEGLVVGALELLADPLGDEPVAAEGFIGDIEGRPVGFGILPRAGDRQADRTFCGMERGRKGIVFFFRGIVVVPTDGIDDVVQHLARAGGPITVP